MFVFMYVYDRRINVFCSVDRIHPRLSLFEIVFVSVFNLFSSSLFVPL
jgi:hypothetical protein